jgi:hypothetical protein
MATFPLAVRNAQLDAHNAKVLAQLESEAADEPVRPGSLPGDELALRGVPVVGRGVAGAIPGTRPGGSLR